MNAQENQFRPKFYPWQKGCPQNVPLGLFWSTSARLPGAISVFDLSPQQEKILNLLYKAGFHRLTVSYPSYTNFPPKSYSHHEHKAPGTDIDFVIRNSNGELAYDPEILRAFLFLSGPKAKSLGFIGGVGIGVGNADAHLHVDMRHAETLRWIEVDKTEGHEVLESDLRWAALFAGTKKIYRWESDDPQVDIEDNGWPMLPLALGAVGAAFGFSKDYFHTAAYGLGGVALGYVAHSILRKVGLDMA